MPCKLDKPEWRIRWPSGLAIRLYPWIFIRRNIEVTAFGSDESKRREEWGRIVRFISRDSLLLYQ